MNPSRFPPPSNSLLPRLRKINFPLPKLQRIKLKKQAAEKALFYVKNGMVLGLGSGSTAEIFVKLLAEKLKNGLLKNIIAVSTSKKTANLARKLGIFLDDLDRHSQLDLAVDGADQVDPDLNLIKGLGHALTREKIVEFHAKKLLIIVDESKMTKRLGLNCPLPIEIIPFGVEENIRWLKTLGCKAQLLNVNGKPFKTDNYGYIVHCFFKNGIEEPYKLEGILDKRPGIVEHGLFLNMADVVIVAGRRDVKVMQR